MRLFALKEGQQKLAVDPVYFYLYLHIWLNSQAKLT
jgi:hypothetical protein